MGRSKKTIKYRVSVSALALQNIIEITGYISFVKHQPINAVRVGDKIYETIERIAKNPYAFPECRENPTQNKIFRQAVCYKWLIIYKIYPDEIVILGIIHSSRKPSTIKTLKKRQY